MVQTRSQGKAATAPPKSAKKAAVAKKPSKKKPTSTKPSKVANKTTTQASPKASKVYKDSATQTVPPVAAAVVSGFFKKNPDLDEDEIEDIKDRVYDYHVELLRIWNRIRKEKHPELFHPIAKCLRIGGLEYIHEVADELEVWPSTS